MLSILSLGGHPCPTTTGEKSVKLCSAQVLWPQKWDLEPLQFWDLRILVLNMALEVGPRTTQCLSSWCDTCITVTTCCLLGLLSSSGRKFKKSWTSSLEALSKLWGHRPKKIPPPPPTFCFTLRKVIIKNGAPVLVNIILE